jgi:hypothetical protein
MTDRRVQMIGHDGIVNTCNNGIVMETNETIQAIERRLIELKQEHRDLDLAIAALVAAPIHDELQLRRLKKRKLLLKDQISFLESQLTPDIPA